MNWEIKRELIEIGIGLASALGGFIIALLHNYRKRLEESKQEVAKLNTHNEKKDLKIEELRNKLSGVGSPEEHKTIKDSLIRHEKRLTQLETKISG